MGEYNQKLTYEELKSRFEKFGLTLISPYRDYTRFDSELQALCEDGHLLSAKANSMGSKRKRNYKCPYCHRNDLIKKMVDFSKREFPTQRKFNSSNGLPSYGTYIKEFGSFKNAIIISGIDIPDERKRFFDRDSYTDEEMLSVLKFVSEERVSEGRRLPTAIDINNDSRMPNETSYNRRFGGLTKAYRLIGIDVDEYNDRIIKDKLRRDFILLKDRIGRTPNSRDLDKYSSIGECHSSSTYISHYGSIHNAQLAFGCESTSLHRIADKDDMLMKLNELGKKIGRTPTSMDVAESKIPYGRSSYARKFGSFEKALRKAGFDTGGSKKVYVTRLGNKCYSRLEYAFTRTLEKYSIPFEKEVMYSKFIDDIDSKWRFDFVIEVNGEKLFVEIFGVTNSKTYDEKTKMKKELCIKNGLHLIDFYPNDFWGATMEDIYNKIVEKANLMDVN